MSTSRPSVSEHIAPVALIVGLALVGAGGLITHPERLFNRYSDLLAYHIGTQSVLYDAWQHERRVPLWRSDLLSGQPAFTNPQSMYTHPFHLLFAVVPAARAVGLVIWLQLLCGAIGTYVATRALHLSTPARVVAAMAVLFSFKTIFAIYAGWLTVLAGLAALPWFFGAAAVAITSPSVRSALFLGLAGALVFHAGHQQIPYYASLYVALWGFMAIAVRLRRRRSEAGRVAASLAGGAAIAMGLCAYRLLPLLGDVPLSSRSHAGIDFFLGARPPALVSLLTFFHPEIFGTPLDGRFAEAWEHVGFVGWAISLCAVVGIVGGRRRPLVTIVLSGLALSLVLAFDTPVLRFAHAAVPGYGLFRLPGRMLLVSAFFLSILAGVGLEVLVQSTRHFRLRRAVALIAVAAVALEGTYWMHRYLNERDPLEPVARAPYLSALKRDLPARIVPLTPSLPHPGTAHSSGLQMTNGNDPFAMRHYQTYVDLLEAKDPRRSGSTAWISVERPVRLDMLAALNTRYVVSPTRLDLPTSEYGLAGVFVDQPQFTLYQGRTLGPAFIYENRRFLSRAFFVDRVVGVSDEQTAITEIGHRDLRETAIVTDPALAGMSASSTDDRVRVDHASGGRLDLTVWPRTRRFLVVSEVWHPGWYARVDGRLAPLTRTNIALMGLWLEPGEHRIEVRFWPTGLTEGLAISAVTTLVVAVLVGLATIRRSDERSGAWPATATRDRPSPR